jgi:hypothetical protein
VTSPIDALLDVHVTRPIGLASQVLRACVTSVHVCHMNEEEDTCVSQ